MGFEFGVAGVESDRRGVGVVDVVSEIDGVDRDICGVTKRTEVQGGTVNLEITLLDIY